MAVVEVTSAWVTRLACVLFYSVNMFVIIVLFLPLSLLTQYHNSYIYSSKFDSPSFLRSFLSSFLFFLSLSLPLSLLPFFLLSFPLSSLSPLSSFPPTPSPQRLSPCSPQRERVSPSRGDSVGLSVVASQGCGEVCQGCRDVIADRFLLRVNSRSWHQTCLRCCVCQLALDRQPSCFIREHNVYCKSDYTR